MVRSFRPHVLGIDDGPFDKSTDTTVPIVGVMMEGADLVETDGQKLQAALLACL